MKRFIVNLLAFDAAWTVAVLAAGKGLAWPGLAAVAVVVALHLAIAPRRAAEAALIAGVGLAGGASDALHLAFGTIAFAPAEPFSPLTLLWFVALWANFATTLTVSLRFLHRRLWAAALLGALGGPLAYSVGERLGAIDLAEPLPRTLALVAVQYAVLLPLSVAAARRVTPRDSEKDGPTRGSTR